MKNLPTHIALNMTSACNMDCSYCYQDKLNSGKRMSIEVVDQVVEMINQTEGQMFDVSFFGGEPTLASRAIEHFICSADLARIESFSLTTNGTNIDVANRVARMGYELSNGRIMTKVMVSNKEVRAPHEDLDLEVISSSYRYIIGIEDLDILNESVVSELLESDFADVDFRFDYYVNWEDVEHSKVARIVEMLRNFQSMTNRVTFNPPKIFKPVLAKKCPAPHMSIDTNGDIMPCHRMFNATRGIGQAVGNIMVDMEQAVKSLASFHGETHVSSSCIGFNANFGQDSDTFVLSLGTTEADVDTDYMLEGELQAAIQQSCR